MSRQRKNQAGITLIALVISIIVMLILAGVSLNATVGENGIVTRAQEAKEAMELAQIKEDLEYMFLDFNIDESENDIAAWLEKKKQEGLIDDFKFWKNEGEETFSYLLSKNGKQFYVAKQGDYYYATETQTSLDSIGAGIAIVTQDSFDASTGNMSFELNAGEKATMYFAEEVSGEFNFEIKGGTVDIYITQDMNLTNEGLKRSAIDIHPNATLNLHIAEGKTLNVNSGFAIDAFEGESGKGGYAGIRVPWIDSNNNGVMDNGEYATLNIKGGGIIKAYGGNASNGGSVNWGRGNGWDSKIGAGGGGAGAGIGGKGGDGGSGKTNPHPGSNGQPGESCGVVNIYGTIKVFAYGGGGGSSGQVFVQNTSGTGGGGYPAAGIGGGGAGAGSGTDCTGSGGYSGGCDHNNSSTNYGRNGLASSGGGYYQGSTGSIEANYGLNLLLGGVPAIGKFGGGENNNHNGGFGGIAGQGGKISKSKDSEVYAYNGNIFTDGTSEHGYSDGENQAYIYAQNGISNKKIIMPANTTGGTLPSNLTYIEASNIDKLLKYDSRLTTKTYTLSDTVELTFDMSKQGIGSGAGYKEISNGEYKIYNEDTIGFTTEVTD